VVISKSTGIAMTVMEINNEEDTYKCTWFPESGFQVHDFKLTEIRAESLEERVVREELDYYLDQHRLTLEMEIPYDYDPKKEYYAMFEFDSIRVDDLKTALLQYYERKIGEIQTRAKESVEIQKELKETVSEIESWKQKE
jgi:uncharacterized protein YodC (DUF2158 family)